MKIAPALLEYWLRDYYFNCSIDISCSGVESFSLGELRDVLQLEQAEMDRIIFRDSESLGAPGLRQAIADRCSDGNPDRVMVTHGSSEAQFLVLNALLQPGDEVVVLEPSYQPLYSIAESIGCKLRSWRLRFDKGFRPDIEEAKRLIGPRTAMVILNFPHNPTGASLTLEEQTELIEAIERVGAYLVWDAAFAELIFDGKPLPDPHIHYERCLSLGTLSKAYGLPGLRIGWALASPDVLARCIQLRDYITLYLSPLVELIAQRAVEQSDRLLGLRLQQTYANLAILTEWCAEHKEFVAYVPPRGGVSTFLRLTGIDNEEAFCHRLAREHKTLLVPGSCFKQPSFVRLGFGGATLELGEGLSRLSTCLRQVAAEAGACHQPAGTFR
jgi:capreomycidine synthase